MQQRAIYQVEPEEGRNEAEKVQEAAASRNEF